jgi:L-asparaginase
MPLDTLSENMTVNKWNILLDELRKVESNKYNRVIILHGTDTLAYTASLLSLVMSEKNLTVCLVSSHSPVDCEGTNANINFRTAVELIMNGIKPNVYAVYQNSDGRTYLHYGAHLLQCRNYSDDFESRTAMTVEDPENAVLTGKAFQTNTMYIRHFQELSPCVLNIQPYVGLCYDAFSLDGIHAVVHGTFHSESVCVERKEGEGAYSSHSLLSLLDRCRNAGIPVFLAPCGRLAYQYESTGDALANGASCISGTTFEMAYVKTLVGCALGFRGEKLDEFVSSAVNWEDARG